jgi:hypothetical protein
MITLAYDRFDKIRNQPYPNGWHELCYKYADTLVDEDWFEKLRKKFKISSNHSELRGNILFKYSGNYTIIKEIDYENYNGNLLFYPIEIYGNHNQFIYDEQKSTETGLKYYTNFKNVISKEAIELAKLNRLIFVINESHEPFSDIHFMNKFYSDVIEIGLSAEMFIFFLGTSNLLELYPEVKSFGFNFYFEDNLLISSCKKVTDLKENSNTILGYKSEWFNIEDIREKRNKWFVCPNRNSNKHHRFSLGCYIESENLWQKFYCSFLKKAEQKPILDGLDKSFYDKLKNASDVFVNRLPIEMDTFSLTESQKESFESMRAFKKEIYLDSYIHIVTETNFAKDIFPTEKIINPITVLQPFILFGAPGYLKYFRSLGFKTFDGFIDESYDLEYNDGKRFEMICNEIKRISELSLDEIHNWYISIIPILEYNRNYAMEFANRNMFIENLKNYK